MKQFDILLETYDHKSYAELMEIREEIWQEILAYERRTDLSSFDIDLDLPSPDHIYETNLLILGKVCTLLAQRHKLERQPTEELPIIKLGEEEM